MATERAQPNKLSQETARATEDVRILLEFLGRRADSLLQAQFEDTRADLGTPMRRLAVPPCRTYKHFLNRFTALETKFHNSDPTQETPSSIPPPPEEGDQELSDLAFLYLSRDFLAAVAAPATVESIRITNAYVACRRSGFFSNLWHLLNAKRTSGAAEHHNVQCEAGARRLASRVVLTEWLALCGTALTLIVSVYAFAGHRILDSQDKIFAEYAAIGHDRVELAKDTPEVKDLTSVASLARVCDSPARPTEAASNDAASPMRSANAGVIAAVEVVPDPARQTIATLSECPLYWRIKQNATNITAVTLHMMSWSGVVINDLKVGELFGINRGFIRRAATNHTEYCQRLGLKIVDGGGCGSALQDIIYHTREVVDSLLGCIALYLLPTLYGGLGAAAATLRALRRKVDLSLVTMTDRGRVQQDIILGVLCGAIIGLFFDYIGKANPQEGLGLSALALLAGYNISGVFSFLDELSNRVFQPGRAGNADNRQG